MGIMKIRALILIGLFGGLFFSAVANAGDSLDISAEPVADPRFSVFLPLVTNNSRPPSIAENAVVLSEETLGVLETISPSALIFSELTPELENLEPGDIIVGDVSANGPTGFLRRVKRVIVGPWRVTVDTEAAALADAIENGTLELHQPLSPSDIQNSQLITGVNLDAAAVNTDTFTFNYTLDEVLIDQDGDYTTTDDQVYVNGQIEIDAAYNLQIDFENNQLQRLEYTLDTEISKELIFYSLVNKLLDYEVVIAEHALAPITFQIGNVPIVIVPVFTLSLGVDGTVYAGLEMGANHTAIVSSGAIYENQVWSHISAYEDEITPIIPGETPLGIGFKGYTSAKLALLFYGESGPNAKITPYLDLIVPPSRSPLWQLYGGLQFSVGIQIQIIDQYLFTYDAVIFDYRVLLAEDVIKPYKPSNPSPPDESSNQSVDVDLSWTGGHPDDKEVLYNVAFGTSPDELTLICENLSQPTCEPGTLEAATYYYWVVYAIDVGESITVKGPRWSFSTELGDNYVIYLPTGTVSLGLTWDGQYLWASDIFSGLYQIEPFGGTVIKFCSLAGVDRYAGLTFDGTYLWLAELNEPIIHQVDPKDCSIIHSIPWISDIEMVSDLAWYGSYLVYTTVLGNYPSIVMVDSQTGDIVVPVYISYCLDCGMAAADHYLWFSTYSTLYKYDLIENYLVGTIPFSSDSGGMAWDGEALWLTSYSNGTITRKIP